MVLVRVSQMSTDCVKTQNFLTLSLAYLFDCSNRVDFNKIKEA